MKLLIKQRVFSWTDTYDGGEGLRGKDRGQDQGEDCIILIPLL